MYSLLEHEGSWIWVENLSVFKYSIKYLCCAPEHNFSKDNLLRIWKSLQEIKNILEASSLIKFEAFY